MRAKIKKVRFTAGNGEFGYAGLDFNGQKEKRQNQKSMFAKIGRDTAENDPPKVSMTSHGVSTPPPGGSISPRKTAQGKAVGCDAARRRFAPKMS